MASLPPSSPGSVDIHLVGSAVDVVRRSASILQQLLQTRFRCEAQILGLDLDLDRASPASRPHITPEKWLEATLSSGVKVSVWRADLANFSVEAVVNAANSKLSHGGGLALALSEAGGADIRRESDDYVRKYGAVKTGDAVALGAGKLRCKRIIHAVGPYLSPKPNDHEVHAARRPLERTVRSILEIVEKEKLDTVAIPAISSGIFNFPVDKCADVIVYTVKTFYGSVTSTRFKPKEVLLVNNDEPTVKEMEQACVKLLPNVVLSSQAAGVSPQTSAPPGLYSHAAASRTTHQTSSSGVQTRKGKGGAQPPEVHFGLVRVLLRKGRLEEQKMDVIVNTAAAHRDLSSGRVSQALLNKAGYRMQEEIRATPPTGSIAITKGYSLHCKKVYHTFCAERTSVGAHQLLFRSVQECLLIAVKEGHQSIALPAIGTGALGFKKQEIAQVMWNAVKDFGMNSQVPLEVHFVIFPSDDAVYKAFEEELRSIRSMASQSPETVSGALGANSKPAFMSEQQQGAAAWEIEPMKSPIEPRIRLQSSSHVIRSEAEAWLRGLLYNQFNSVYTISNNFIQLLGERDLEKLAQTQVEGVQLEEFLEKGRSGFIVNAEKEEEIAVAALKLQQMLQKVQTQYLKEEVEELKAESGDNVKMERNPVSRSDPDVKPFVKQLQKHGLHTHTAERVENPALEKVFKQQKAQMSSRFTDDLLQLVPAQFCDLVSHVGFRPECAPPNDSFLGEGLYFTADIDTALRLWNGNSDKYLYVFVAEVVKRRPGHGRPGLVVAPGQDSGPGSDPTTRCDCVEKSGVTVIFNHRQARPKFILTCSKDMSSPV